MKELITAEHRGSFGAMVLLVAATAIVLGALHFAAAVVTPVLLALVLTLIFWPVYAWLNGRGLRPVLSLLILMGGLIVGFVLFAALITYSVSGLATQLSVYADRLASELQGLDAWLQSQGLTDAQLATLLSPETIASIFGAFVSGLANALSQAVLILFLLLFFLADGPAVMHRLRASLDADDPNAVRLVRYGQDVGRYFILRAAVNAVTGAGVALVLWLLGVDFPVLWGVLTFFLSFVPYVGMFLASVPSVVLAWAEFGLVHALVVAVALTVVNAVAENLVQPMLMNKGLGLSPTFVFLSVFFWAWLIGGGGGFLAIPLSLGLLAILANFPGARWFVHAASTRSAQESDP